MTISQFAMHELDGKPTRRVRLGVAAGVAVLHLAVLVALIRGFAPDLASTVVGPALQAFDITLPETPPPPKTVPAPSKPAAERDEGRAAPAGKMADTKPVSAPPARITLSPTVAAPVSGKGNAVSAGAAEAGVGTGAGGVGNGLGSGNSGDGTGGGGGSAKAVKIAGDIVSARDYPRATRDSRLGSSVTIMLTVTREGRVGGCRVARPSHDPEADRITCRLATERFRFRPALDSSGRPIEAVYGWQQRWFTPASK